MDEELRAEEPEHEPVPPDAAEQVTRLAATAVQPGRMSAIYLGHGAPPLVDDPLWVVQLAAWARAMPRPRAILMVSAHWESAPLTIGATDDGVPLVYDFGGFAERYYRAQYPAPGAPALAALAAQVRGLLAAIEPVTDLPGRGLDHGAYVPLTVMYPDADIPVLQISMPSLDPQRLMRIGQALRRGTRRPAPAPALAPPPTPTFSPIRNERVVCVLTHRSMRQVSQHKKVIMSPLAGDGSPGRRGEGRRASRLAGGPGRRAMRCDMAGG
jgi:hypothetical protein